MKTYKAVVKDKQTKRYLVIESEYNTQKEFLSDLRANGYSIYRNRIAESSKFDKLIMTKWANEY